MRNITQKKDESTVIQTRAMGDFFTINIYQVSGALVERHPHNQCLKAVPLIGQKISRIAIKSCLESLNCTLFFICVVDSRRCVFRTNVGAGVDHHDHGGLGGKKKCSGLVSTLIKFDFVYLSPLCACFRKGAIPIKLFHDRFPFLSLLVCVVYSREEKGFPPPSTFCSVSQLQSERVFPFPIPLILMSKHDHLDRY